MALALSACEAGEGGPAGRPSSAEARARGRTLFLAHCALCHGERADGRGRRSQALSGPPADFSDPHWSGRTPPQRTFEIIRNGKRGTSMPAWKALREDEIWDLVAYLHSVASEGAELSP